MTWPRCSKNSNYLLLAIKKSSKSFSFKYREFSKNIHWKSSQPTTTRNKKDGLGDSSVNPLLFYPINIDWRSFKNQNCNSSTKR